MDKTCILIVDDNPEIREIINVLLGGEGFEVSEAENGAQALTLIEQQDFDLIILDIMMPGPNGYQTCRKLTNQMFSYALVSEEQETPDMSWLSTDYIFQCIQENCDFISLAGFTTNVKIPEVTGILLSDKTMINRIFTNLFSNILKYGDKGTPVIVRSSIRKQRFTVTVSNAIKQEHSDVGSSNIGLRNVQRMMQMMDGEMLLTKKTSSDSPGNHNISQNTSSAFASENVSGVFEVTLWFPLR